jgi:hypothetical protein
VHRLAITSEDVCPICYDSMTDGDPAGVAWCSFGCGGNFHLRCVQAWIDSKAADGEQGTCPICRIEIESPDASSLPVVVAPEVRQEEEPHEEDDGVMLMEAARASLDREFARIAEQQRRIAEMIEAQDRARSDLQRRITARFGRSAPPKLAVRIPDLFARPGTEMTRTERPLPRMIDAGTVRPRSEALAETVPRGATIPIDQDEMTPRHRSISPGEGPHRRALTVNSEHRDPTRPISASASLGDEISRSFAPDREAPLPGERPIPESVSFEDDLISRRRSSDDDAGVLIHQGPDHEAALRSERPIPESVSYGDDLPWTRRSPDDAASVLIHQSPDREPALHRAANEEIPHKRRSFDDESSMPIHQYPLDDDALPRPPSPTGSLAIRCRDVTLGCATEDDVLQRPVASAEPPGGDVSHRKVTFDREAGLAMPERDNGDAEPGIPARVGSATFGSVPLNPHSCIDQARSMTFESEPAPTHPVGATVPEAGFRARALSFDDNARPGVGRPEEHPSPPEPELHRAPSELGDAKTMRRPAYACPRARTVNFDGDSLFAGTVDFSRGHQILDEPGNISDGLTFTQRRLETEQRMRASLATQLTMKITKKQRVHVQRKPPPGGRRPITACVGWST